MVRRTEEEKDEKEWEIKESIIMEREQRMSKKGVLRIIEIVHHWVSIVRTRSRSIHIVLWDAHMGEYTNVSEIQLQLHFKSDVYLTKIQLAICSSVPFEVDPQL